MKGTPVLCEDKDIYLQAFQANIGVVRSLNIKVVAILRGVSERNVNVGICSDIRILIFSAIVLIATGFHHDNCILQLCYVDR